MSTAFSPNTFSMYEHQEDEEIPSGALDVGWFSLWLCPSPQAALWQTLRPCGVLTLALCLGVTAGRAIAVMARLPILSAQVIVIEQFVSPLEAINDYI